MSLAIFNTEEDVVVEQEKDTVGGFTIWDSGLYKAVLKAAFLGEYDAGSKYIEVIVEATNDKGETLTHSEREVVWSAKSKGTFYICKKTGKKKQLIGLAKMNALGELLTGKGLKDSLFENKYHNLYNKDAGGEVPVELPTLTDWCGKDIFVGLQRITENKQVKSGNSYVDTNEPRDINEVNKYFDEDKKSNLEVKAGTDAEFVNDWVKANEGKTRNKFKAVTGGPVAGGVPSATAAPLKFNT